MVPTRITRGLTAMMHLGQQKLGQPGCGAGLWEGLGGPAGQWATRASSICNALNFSNITRQSKWAWVSCCKVIYILIYHIMGENQKWSYLIYFSKKCNESHKVSDKYRFFFCLLQTRVKAILPVTFFVKTYSSWIF